MTPPERSRKIILQMGISLDGFVAGPGGTGLVPVIEAWGLPPEDPGLTETKVAWLREAGAHIMGRVTYEEMASFWPSSTADYAAPMNEIPKVVFSKDLARAEWPESPIAHGDLAEEIASLKRESGKDIIAHGGASFAQSLAQLGLIDEYRLITHPVALANGAPLFKDLPLPYVSGFSKRGRSRAPPSMSTNRPETNPTLFEWAGGGTAIRERPMLSTLPSRPTSRSQHSFQETSAKSTVTTSLPGGATSSAAHRCTDDLGGCESMVAHHRGRGFNESG